MTALTPKDMELIKRTPLLMDIPEKELNRLLEASSITEQPRGKLLFLRGEAADHIFLLLEGWVKVFRDSPEGEQIVIGVLKPGETIAEAAIFLGRDYPASAEVVGDARLLEIPSGVLLALLREDGELGIRMLGTLSQRLRGLVLHIEQIQARSTPQRLGEFLLGLCETCDGGETETTINLPYDKSLVAARLGMKPESLSRALVKLRDVGVTTQGHQVMLGNISQLRSYCSES